MSMCQVYPYFNFVWVNLWSESQMNKIKIKITSLPIYFSGVVVENDTLVLEYSNELWIQQNLNSLIFYYLTQDTPWIDLLYA